MPQPIDLTGQKFGSLTVLALDSRRARVSRWTCLCDCGTECVKNIGNLRSGHTRSCGCLRAKTSKTLKTKHGKVGTRAYMTWRALLARCCNPNAHAYENYGGRGIKVCERWQSFENFYADMGERPKGMTIGRIDNDGGYEPGNCRWESYGAQARNKRSTKLFELHGEVATLSELCERRGLNTNTIKNRIYTYGWAVEDAFSIPIGQKRSTTSNPNEGK